MAAVELLPGRQKGTAMSDEFPRGRVWIIHRDDEVVWQFCCPGCGLRADIDDDQLHGRVSIDCPECDYHETLTETPKVIAGPESRAEEEDEGHPTVAPSSGAGREPSA